MSEGRRFVLRTSAAATDSAGSGPGQGRQERQLSEQQREKRRRVTERYQTRLASRGLRQVTFIVPLELWERFIRDRCQGGGPGKVNAVFLEWLREPTRPEKPPPGAKSPC